MQRDIVVIAHNIRSSHNIGSLLRTCDGLGIDKVYLTGYTPYPQSKKDKRLPHISRKVDAAIHKTALGAEVSQDWEQGDDVLAVIESLKSNGYQIAALEQAKDSIKLPSFRCPEKLILILGEEVNGIDTALLKQVDVCLEIPMHGQKESFNVVQAAAMALYQFRHL